VCFRDPKMAGSPLKAKNFLLTRTQRYDMNIFTESAIHAIFWQSCEPAKDKNRDRQPNRRA